MASAFKAGWKVAVWPDLPRPTDSSTQITGDTDKRKKTRKPLLQDGLHGNMYAFTDQEDCVDLPNTSLI